MPAQLLFPDSATATDVLTFASRASRLGEQTGVRFVARDGVLAMSCAVLSSRGLFDASPTVIALRVVEVDPELVCDVVVSASALRGAADDANAVDLPESALSAAWAGISPPREGWHSTRSLSAATFAARAQWGIAAVADAIPRDSGDDIVHAVRTKIWGAPDDDLAGMPLGVAFAAFSMGFIAGEEAVVVREAPAWHRATFTRGHVLVRVSAHQGLTAVRTTGSG